jgi:hypothetical protein
VRGDAKHDGRRALALSPRLLKVEAEDQDEKGSEDDNFQRYTFVVDRTKKTFALEHDMTVSQRDLLLSQAPITKLLIGTVFTTDDSTAHWIDDVVVVASP